MSYDVYVWHRAVGDVQDVLDGLADEDPSGVESHPSVLAFREALLAGFPRLVDVIDPEAMSEHASTYVVLTLPFPWVGDLRAIEQLAVRHELTGWDPQAGARIRVPGRGPVPPASIGTGAGRTRWAVDSGAADRARDGQALGPHGVVTGGPA